MATGFKAWHPDVHERFGGRLFFFLIAINSYNEQDLRRKLQQLFSEFGIAAGDGHEGYGAYEVLGEFDYMLRVWLPADMDNRFVEKARQLLPIDIVLQFTSQQVVSDWRFTTSPVPSTIQQLDRNEIARVQHERTENAGRKFVDEGVAYWVPYLNERKRSGIEPIKAFICMRQPAKTTDKALSALEKKIIGRIKADKGVDQRTIHRGVGFAWLLAKVVANDFHALAKLVRGISAEFGEFGVSTSTYAATHRLAEGDDIRLKALESDRSGMERVEEFLPVLRDRDLSVLDEESKQFRQAVVSFIEREVLPAKLNEANQVPMRSLLGAVLREDEEAAMEALYLPTIRAERAIRERLLTVASRSPREVKGLFTMLAEMHQDVKRAETITLGACLLAAREYVRVDTPNAGLAKEFSDERIREIVNTRNKVMHGAVPRLREQWESLATYLLYLSEAQHVFLTSLSETLHATTDTV